ncbi:hypothetical protein TeGR_g10765 [Tetraparma gracilis]|uniref:Cyclic nucleotide-binding domain-containing protein n=1 Tax=Tetraparma gracilis TaxID=2962635 RepID=A0ABQ6MZA7_9STRA|nr:hypothetical protein TeGR_g10765 [Tetraparma gracilis]
MNSHRFLPFFQDPTTLSNICGHTSFLLLGTSYLTTDILSLRCLAMSGMSLSIIFQFYRPVPLTIPIRWNLLFLAINSVMVAALLKERMEASQMSPQMQDLYDKEFKKMGFTQIEFHRLASNGSLKTLPRGSSLAVASQKQHHMYFLVSGRVSVRVGDKTVATVMPNAFVGEMSFLTYLSDLTDSEAMATCEVSSDEALVLEWDFEALEVYLQGDRGLRNALQAYISNDLRKKLSNMSSAQLLRMETSPHIHRLHSHRTNA